MLCGRAGEAAVIDDRDQAAQMPQIDIHTHSVSIDHLMHYVNGCSDATVMAWIDAVAI
jgi:hypothetical protein